MGMTKNDRLLFILNLLRSRKNLNAEQLAKECGVTERSIYRDITSLSQANIPIYFDRGYKFATDNFLPPLNFSLQEYSTLKAVLESSPLKSTGKYRQVIRELLAKVEASLSQSVREEKKRGTNSANIDIQTTYRSDRLEKWYGQLESAISADKKIQIKYDSLKSGVMERVVEPYFMVFRGRSFYLVGYCVTRKEFRTFRIDRIQSLIVLDERFTRQKGVDAQSYFEGSWEVYHGHPVEITVRLTGAAAKVVLSSRHHASESIEQLDNESVLYKATVNGLDEIQRWILGFGTEATVIAPVELRTNLERIGRYLSTRYLKPAKPSQRRWSIAERQDS